MPTKVTNYQCPTCTGPLHFVGSSGKLECDYCGSSYDVAEIEALYAEKNEKAAAAMQTEAADDFHDTEWDMSEIDSDWGADAAGMRAYSCPSCGAELICDETTAATSCPYCGNPTVVPGQFAGTLKPDYVLPFRLSKDDAIKALKQHYRNKPLLPNTFSDANHLQEIKGVYVPFWLFDGVAEGYAQYHARNTHITRLGEYEITQTDHYDVRRAGSLPFEKIPVDASTKMPDDYMDSIEPYHYADLKPFSAAYLPGFLADKFDVSAADSASRADERCIQTIMKAFDKTVVGYSGKKLESSQVHLNRGKVRYALMPVWLLNTKWEGKNFLFAMNGQTGKMVGDLPISKKKALGIFAAIAAPLIAVGTALALVLVR